MPHTTTKALRIKRPDSRPNGKRRAKLNKGTNEDLKIQDIRVTKTHSKDKKDRNSESATQTAELPKDIKLVRALKKKLRAIAQLLDDQKNGKLLNEEQLKKIESMGQAMNDLEALTEQ